MDLEELREKLQRLQESVSDTQLMGEKVNGPQPPSGSWARVPYNFQNNWTPTKLKRLAFNVIRDIADLQDHLKSASRGMGRDTAIVDQAIKQSFELSLIIDLANRDKHANHDRKTWSGKAPRLTNLKRVFQVKSKVRPGQDLQVGLDFTPTGVMGFGESVGVVITGDIIGKGAEHLSTLTYALDMAIEALENLATELGITK